MKYQIGDDIIVLQTHEEGKVVEIVNEKMVMIEIRGVKFPAYMDQIDFPYFYRFSKKNIVPTDKKAPKVFVDNIPKEKSKPSQLNMPNGIWLVFIPKFCFDEFDDEYVQTLKIHIINNTNYDYRIEYENTLNGRLNFDILTNLYAYHDFYIHDLGFEFVNDSPVFNVIFSLLKPQKNKAEFHETSLKLKPKQIFQAIEKMKENNEPTFSYKLFDEMPEKQKEEPKLSLDKLKQNGYKVYEVNDYKKHIGSARTVIDLHIEKININYTSLSNAEILDIQLSEFEKWYSLAVLNKLEKFTVVHGIGEGKLKNEIHQILNTKKEVKSFYNQFTDAFGFGATEIYFK